jgi:hypothetical protein
MNSLSQSISTSDSNLFYSKLYSENELNFIRIECNAGYSTYKKEIKLSY